MSLATIFCGLSDTASFKSLARANTNGKPSAWPPMTRSALPRAGARYGCDGTRRRGYQLLGDSISQAPAKQCESIVPARFLTEGATVTEGVSIALHSTANNFKVTCYCYIERQQYVIFFASMSGSTAYHLSSSMVMPRSRATVSK